MTGKADSKAIPVTEFGVGLENDEVDEFVLVPVDAKVQTALRDMISETRKQLNTMTPSLYEPTEKYSSSEHLHLPLDDDLASQLRAIHEANNLPVNAKILSDPAKVFCYFARTVDGHARRITGIRRAGTFKGILKSRLVQLATDALKIVEDKVFKLDSDFDLLVETAGISILRPSGFEFVGELKHAILAAAPTNIKKIQHDLPFVDFSSIEGYATKHPRAARYLASIRVQKEAKDIDKGHLKKLCADTGVKIREEKGKIVVVTPHVFLPR